MRRATELRVSDSEETHASSEKQAPDAVLRRIQEIQRLQLADEWRTKHLPPALLAFHNQRIRISAKKFRWQCTIPCEMLWRNPWHSVQFSSAACAIAGLCRPLDLMKKMKPPQYLRHSGANSSETF
ncbi:hypothetical protein ABZP36_035318 [Zizania latifolia]